MAWRASVGLDIGTHGVYVAEVTDTRHGPRLTNFGGLALPEGAVEAGEIVDVGAVAETARELFEAAGIRGKRVHVGVANEKVSVRQIDLPFTHGDQLGGVLGLSAQAHIPMPVEEAELDHQELERVAGPDGAGMLRCLVVAADREMLAGYVAVATRAGLRPVGADLNVFAALRSIAPDPGSVTGSQALVDVGAAVTKILIHSQGIARIVRFLVLGGGDLTRTLSAELGVTPDEAERIKRGEVPDEGSQEADRVIDRWTLELVGAVRGSIGYYLATPRSTAVERVLVTGGGSQLPGLRRRLEDELNTTVERARPFAHLEVEDTDHGTEDLAAVEPLLATAIGLARGPREGSMRVDLLPRDDQRRERDRRVRSIVVAGGLGLVGIAGAYLFRVLRAKRRSVEGPGGWESRQRR